MNQMQVPSTIIPPAMHHDYTHSSSDDDDDNDEIVFPLRRAFPVDHEFFAWGDAQRAHSSKFGLVAARSQRLETAEEVDLQVDGERFECGVKGCTKTFAALKEVCDLCVCLSAFMRRVIRGLANVETFSLRHTTAQHTSSSATNAAKPASARVCLTSTLARCMTASSERWQRGDPCTCASQKAVRRYFEMQTPGKDTLFAIITTQKRMISTDLFGRGTSNAARQKAGLANLARYDFSLVDRSTTLQTIFADACCFVSLIVVLQYPQGLSKR